jgi:hypothetical protein
VSYQKSQDIHGLNKKTVDLYAPDCVRGNDGRYYLFYSAMGPNVKPFGPISVAVSNKPEGPFSYYGDVKDKTGLPLLKYLNNDPAVINDNGRIFLYYGWGFNLDFRSRLFAPLFRKVINKITGRSSEEIKSTKPSITCCAEVELCSDMLTALSEPKAVLDSKTTAPKRTDYHKHAFYEAPSIRKIKGFYYLVYSCGTDNALAYATSLMPDSGFAYRGLIVSNSDLGYKGNTKPLAPAGTIHGCIEEINREFYVFYHRCTHNTDFSRQACAEKIQINEDGSIDQVEITSQGLNGKSLGGEGTYPAVICCNLFNQKLKGVQGNGHEKDSPNITNKGEERFVTAISNQTYIGYKYFHYRDIKEARVRIRGSKGIIKISLSPTGPTLGEAIFKGSANWEDCLIPFQVKDITDALYFQYCGKGKIDFIEFELKGGLNNENRD